MVNAISVTEIMDEIHKAYNGLTELKPGEFTIRMYADRHNLSYNQAMRQLARAVREGQLEMVDCKRVINGRAQSAYRQKA